MQWLAKLLGGGVLNGLDAMLARFLRNRDAAEANLHGEQMAAMGAMAAEFAPRGNRTWWDSLIDGLNRLPRPLLVFMVVGVLVWAPLDPPGFAAVMTAYGLIPEWLVIVMGQIILLFCGGRMLEKWPERLRGPDPASVREALAVMRGLRGTAGAALAGDGAGRSDERPANPSVQAWLARQSTGVTSGRAAAATNDPDLPHPFEMRFDGP